MRILVFIGALFSTIAHAATEPKTCPVGYVSNFVCTAQAEREGWISDKGLMRKFKSLRVCQKSENNVMLVEVTTPRDIYTGAMRSDLGYGRYSFSFLDNGQQKDAAFSITVSRPPFPATLSVDDKLAFYLCDR